MAGRPREPIELIKAKGRKHLTEDEYENRKNGEIIVPFIDVQAPKYLTAAQKKEFDEIADKLVQLGIFTELDVDILAQYCVAKSLYLDFNSQLKKVMSKKNAVHKWDVVESLAEDCAEQEELKKLLEAMIRRQRGDDAKVLMDLQDKAFRQCRSCARELGLGITNRLKLVVPEVPEEDDDL